MDYFWFIIYLVILLLLSFIMIRQKRLPYGIVFVVAFVFFPLLSTMGLGGLYLPSDATHLCVLISIVGFFLFYKIGKITKISSTRNNSLLQTEYETNYTYVILSNLLCFAVYLYLLPHVREYYAYHLLSDGREEGTLEFLGNARIAALYGTLVKPIISISFIIIVDDLFRGKKIHYLAGILCIINMVLDGLIFAGRALIVQSVFYVFFSILFFRKEVKLTKKQKRILLLSSLVVVSLLIFVVVFISESRSGGDDSHSVVTTHFIWYYVGPFLLFDYYVQNHNLLSLNNDLFYGSCLFGPIYNLFYMSVSAVFPSIDYMGSDHLIATVTQNLRAPIGNGIYINAAVTAMYPFLKDFWFIGLFLGFGFYGFLLGLFEKSYSKKMDKRLRIVILVILYVIFKLEMRYELGPTLVIQIILIFLFLKKKTWNYVQLNKKHTKL